MLRHKATTLGISFGTAALVGALLLTIHMTAPEKATARDCVPAVNTTTVNESAWAVTLHGAENICRNRALTQARNLCHPFGIAELGTPQITSRSWDGREWTVGCTQEVRCLRCFGPFDPY